MTIQLERRRAYLMSGAATGLALLFAAQAAHAQTAPAAAPVSTTEELVVTGIRSAIQNSIAVKKDAETIVEVVSAEDIGKLPDQSIAESLARLPGVTAQRLDGRSQMITIRGLGPDFTTGLLNGREQVTTGDNRGVEFDQFPAELLGQVVVYKTPDAKLIGQALGGTVDMRTIRPLEYGRRAVALNVRYEWDDKGALNAGTKDTGWRYSGTYIDQFADGKIGVALGYAHLDSPYQAERFNAWGYPNIDANNVVIGGAKPYVMSAQLKRDGYMGTLEFRPNDNLTSTFDAFYSEFKNTQILRGIELPLWWGGLPLQPGYVTSGGLVVQGQFNGVKGVVRNDANTRDAKTTSLGWNTTYKFNDMWSASLDLSYSHVKRTDLVLETYSGTGGPGQGAKDNLAFTETDSGAFFSGSIINYADFNTIKLTSPQGWGGDIIPGGQVGYYNSPSIDDEIKAVRATASRAFDNFFLSSLDFGVNYSEREKSLVANEFFMGLADPANNSVPAQYRLGTTSLAFLGIAGMISYDPLALLNSGIYSFKRNPNADVVTKNWDVQEKVWTGYVQGNIKTELFDMPLTGNVGLQVVRTEQTGAGMAAGPNGASPINSSITYTEALPSTNLALAFGDDNYLRLAAARVMARPRMDQERGSFQYSFNASKVGSTDINNSPWGGSGGNPKLKPLIADSFDLSFEKYFGGRKGYVSVAAFFKHLETFVYDKNVLFDFTGFPTGGFTPALHQGIVSQPENGQGGHIYGLEATISVPLDLIWEPLDGFGVQVSGSSAQSKVREDSSTPPIAMPGLSRNVLNATVYYEKYGFQARLSSRTRSSFLGEVAGFGDSRTFRMVKSETVVDGQIGYEFQSGPLKGLSALFQVNNITDEPFTTFQTGNEKQVIDYQKYGRTYLFGVNYKF